MKYKINVKDKTKDDSIKQKNEKRKTYRPSLTQIEKFKLTIEDTPSYYCSIF